MILIYHLDTLRKLLSSSSYPVRFNPTDVWTIHPGGYNIVGEVCVCLQLNMFQRRLTGQPIGFSVLGIFVVNRKTVLSVSTRTSGFHVHSKSGGSHSQDSDSDGVALLYGTNFHSFHSIKPREISSYFYHFSCSGNLHPFINITLLIFSRSGGMIRRIQPWRATTSTAAQWRRTLYVLNSVVICTVQCSWHCWFTVAAWLTHSPATLEVTVRIPPSAVILRFKYISNWLSPTRRDLNWPVWHCTNTVTWDVSGDNG